MEVAGVDGCPGGWVIAWAQTDSILRFLTSGFAADFAEVLDRTRDCAAVGIDIPVGLSDNSRRQSDVEARRLLRPLRHSSVFPSPIRPVFGIVRYAEACKVSARFHVDGNKISKQTYFMARRIKEVDDLMTPELQTRVREVHPEVCFWALNGKQPVADRKRSPAGERQRRDLLNNVFAEDVGDIEVPRQADRDDLYDALAAAWTASRIVGGQAQTVPTDPDIDSRSLRMEIVY